MKPGMNNSVKKEKPETGASGIVGLGKMSLLQQQKQKNTTTLHDQLSSSSESESDRLEEYLKFYMPTNCSYEMKFQDWLFEGCDKDVKDDIFKSVCEQAEKLGIQEDDRGEWARKTVISVINEISDSGMFLQKLIRSNDNNNNNNNILEDQNRLKNEKNRREIAAACDFRFSKTQKSIVDSKKKERKIVSKSKDGEEKDFHGKFEDEKLEVEDLARRLEELEVSLRRIKEEKEQDNALLMEAERIYTLEKENSKREVEVKIQEAMDEVKRLKHVISQLRTKIYSSSSTAAATIDYVMKQRPNLFKMQ